MVKLPDKVQAAVGKAVPGTLRHGGAGASRSRKDQTKNRYFYNKNPKPYSPKSIQEPAVDHSTTTTGQWAKTSR